jgi:hypothetical protein
MLRHIHKIKQAHNLYKKIPKEGVKIKKYIKIVLITLFVAAIGIVIALVLAVTLFFQFAADFVPQVVDTQIPTRETVENTVQGVVNTGASSITPLLQDQSLQEIRGQIESAIPQARTEIERVQNMLP